jgi:hypothetical protein
VGDGHTAPPGGFAGFQVRGGRLVPLVRRVHRLGRRRAGARDRRERRTVRRLTAQAVAGSKTIVVPVPQRRGRYTLSLAAIAGDQCVIDAAWLTVVRGPA